MAISNISKSRNKFKHESCGEKNILQLFAVGKKSLAIAKAITTSDTFFHHSAAVHLHDIEPGIVGADYTGPITQTCWDNLSVQADLVTQHAKVKIIRLDKALMLFARPITPLATYHAYEPPGCFMVRLDQLAAVFAFTQQLAKAGVLRSVFVAGQDEALAMSWALEVAG